MKDIEIHDRLAGDASITALVGDRIWTTWLPENASLPAITCNYSGDRPVNTLAGDTLQGRETITVNIWSRSKVEISNLITLAKARLNGFAVRGNMIDLSEEEEGIYRFAIDYSIF